MGEEQRRYTRVATRLVAFLKVVETGKVHRGLTRDLSTGGVCATIETPLAVGTPLEVEIKLPDREQEIRFLAEVAWTKPVEAGKPGGNTDVGIKFVSIDPKARSAIMHYAMLNAVPPDPA